MASLRVAQARIRPILRTPECTGGIPLTRSLHSALRSRDRHDNAQPQQDNDNGIRERAIKARQPNYAGWWTEVMNYHQTPQTAVDSTLLLSEDHVFQGRPAVSAPVPAPTESEKKKGYSNTLPTAQSTRTENTLPTAVSRGSSTFATGTQSSLSKPADESIPYHGFAIPVKPTPPGSEDCCMSGCAHCIYDIYEEDRQEYKRKLAIVLQDIEKAGLPPPPNIATKSSTTADGSPATEDDDGMDPGMKAFLELERKLKGS
ncbi:hypothetical protein EC968_003600 [Mortierella alpina]|nr:hypothetical protein EC968_003600 [Mortierella alpina]